MLGESGKKSKEVKFFAGYINQNCHIAFLQETFIAAECESMIKNKWNGTCYFSNGMNHSKGVAILMADNLPVGSVKCYTRGDGRIIALRFGILGKSYFCVCKIRCIFEKGVTYLMAIRYPFMLYKIGMELLASFWFLTSGFRNKGVLVYLKSK